MNTQQDITQQTNYNSDETEYFSCVSQEERVKNLASRLASFPVTLEMLETVIGAVIRQPKERRYREIKTTNKRFLQTIKQAPNSLGTRFLMSVGFEVAGEWLMLKRLDLDLLLVGQSALKLAGSSLECSLAREERAKAKAQEAERAREAVAEQARRDAHAANVPAEPAEGAMGTTRIAVVDSASGKTLQRRFLSDDVLRHVISWLGSQSSKLPARLESGLDVLVDDTMFPARKVDVSECSAQTLQGLGFWPSALLRVQAAPAHPVSASD